MNQEEKEKTFKRWFCRNCGTSINSEARAYAKNKVKFDGEYMKHTDRYEKERRKRAEQLELLQKSNGCS